MIIIIIGISGSGKTTIGKLLSKKLGLDFYDADDFHSKKNIDKMKNNIPLDDDDRKPWLIKLSKKIKFWSTKGGAVLACSALKESYRKLLISRVEKFEFIYLHVPKDLLKKRIKKRVGHFAKTKIIKSQYDALEIPAYGLHIDNSSSPEITTEFIKLNLQIR